MTYDEYTRYLNSAAWVKRVRQAKAAAEWRCVLCNSPEGDVALQGHHRTYERLGHERLADITILCDDCHGLFHKRLPEFARVEET